MKTDVELDLVLHEACFDCKTDAQRRKLLRSIELDAWREARELVEKLKVYYAGSKMLDDTSTHESFRRKVMSEMDRIIQQLQLK